ncbi:hypothetical protein CGRA01v4_14034 [Colletotrichum graminicola]|nr:hypothetical protein CGRA01v4_14034 [Colletotrichum graminicola]
MPRGPENTTSICRNQSEMKFILVCRGQREQNGLGLCCPLDPNFLLKDLQEELFSAQRLIYPTAVKSLDLPWSFPPTLASPCAVYFALVCARLIHKHKLVGLDLE